MILYTKPQIYFAYQDDLSLTQEALNLEEKGIALLQKNRLCVIILAGGQGTRLGSKNPKGCYTLPTIQKSIFEIHCRSIYKAQNLYNTKIKLLIMTSSYTHDYTTNFFRRNDYFGLNKDQITFFQQTNSTCFDFNDAPLPFFDDFATAPNGNGAIFRVMRDQNLFEVISDCKYCTVVSVDNVLARLVDPICIGLLEQLDLDAVNKGVERMHNESVGIFTKKGDHLVVKEYSELEQSPNKGKLLSDQKDSQGNICNHTFKINFMKEASELSLPAHKAYKKIPYTDEKGEIVEPLAVNGYKTELFIFDALQFTKKSIVMAVPRVLEFAPVKNGPKVPSDNPETAVKALQERNSIFCKMAGVPEKAQPNDFDILIFKELNKQ